MNIRRFFLTKRRGVMKSPHITSTSLIVSFVLLSIGAPFGIVEAQHATAAGTEVLYQTTFDDLALGPIDGQDNWIVTQRSIPEPFDWGVVVDDGTGNQVLEIRSGFSSKNEAGFGGEVLRFYTPTSKRFVTVEMDFLLPELGRFYFMDNQSEDNLGPSRVFWFSDGRVGPAFSSVFAQAQEDTWHRLAITVDQTIRTITEFWFDGVAQPVTDSDYWPPSTLSNFTFSGAGSGFDQPGRLWIDNLSITSAPGPEVLNDLVSFDPDPSTYYFTPNTTGCPSGFVGKFGFEAQLANISESTLAELQVRVAEFSNGNLVLTEAGTTIGEGDSFPVPEKDDYTDSYLAPSEAVDVPFTICLKSMQPFRFFVDVLGVIDDSEVTFAPVDWTIELDTQGDGVHTIFMIADVSPMTVDDLQDLGGRLTWEQTEIDLCADPTYPPVNWGGLISIRQVGEDFLRIGDGFQTDYQGTGCEINDAMQRAFDDFGLPKTACIWVRSRDVKQEFCSPLNVIQ